MVLLTTTPEILSAISLLPSDSPLQTQSTTPNSSSSEANPTLPLLPTTLSQPISHKTLIALSQTLKSKPPSSPSPNTTTNSYSYTLNALLHNTSLYTPPPPSPSQPSASYLALKARLLREQEQRQYAALLNRKSHPQSSSLSSLLHPSHLTSEDPNNNNNNNNNDDDDDPLTPSLILNILLSILLCAFSVFYATRNFPNDGVRVLLSLGTGIVVGVAETVIYAAYLRKVEGARRREGRVRERKVVVGREEVGGHGPERVDGDVEKEEIWGRGVNGGVRRRIRERWEKGQQAEGENLNRKVVR